MEKKLYRSTTDKMIGGVCGGFAEYANVDATIVRVVYAGVTVFSAFFLGLFLYLMCLIIIPVKPESPEA